EDLDYRAQLVTGADMQEFISRRFAPVGNPNPATWLAGVTGGEIYVAGQPYQNDRHEQESSSYALFTNNSIAFTDQLELTLGLRYTKEEKELRTLYNNANGGAACGQVLANVVTFSQQIPAAMLPTFLLTTCAS